jgi:hypothetical protein
MRHVVYKGIAAEAGALEAMRTLAFSEEQDGLLALL